MVTAALMKKVFILEVVDKPGYAVGRHGPGTFVCEPEIPDEVGFGCHCDHSIDWRLVFNEDVV